MERVLDPFIGHSESHQGCCVFEPSCAVSLTELAHHLKRRLTRMFGKAVKIRHCPATVSATTRLAVDSSRASPRNPARCHWDLSFRRGLGRRFGKAQVRRPVLGATHFAYVPRGTEDTDVFCILAVSARACLQPYGSFIGQAAPVLPLRSIAFTFRYASACRRHSRHGDRHQRRHCRWRNHRAA